jgi:hypothetical protein
MNKTTKTTGRYYIIHTITQLERAILDALSSHVGKDNALPLKTLIKDLRLIPALGSFAKIQVSYAVSRLRKSGRALICSTHGNESFYWLASNLDEVLDFVEHEVHPRAEELVEIEYAMINAALKAFGRPHQQPPF